MAKGVVIGGLNNNGSNIKSIQRGVSTLNNIGSITANIGNVDTTKSIILITRITYSDVVNIGGGLVRATFNSSTQLAFTKQITTGLVEVYWTVIEFNNVKSKQNGVNTIGTTLTSVTISAVDISKSLLFTSYTSTESGSNNAYGVPTRSRLLNSTTIEFQTSLSNKTAAWQVIEFN